MVDAIEVDPIAFVANIWPVWWIMMLGDRNTTLSTTLIVTFIDTHMLRNSPGNRVENHEEQRELHGI